MRKNILYTLGDKGDIFFDSREKALQESTSRLNSDKEDWQVKKLNYYPSFGGKSSVIQVSYLSNQCLRFYAIEDGYCVKCSIPDKGMWDGFTFEWSYLEIGSKELEMVENWYGRFDLLNRNNIEEIDALELYKLMARRWIRTILADPNVLEFNEGIKKYGLRPKFASLVRLVYASDCYLAGDIKIGDWYLQRVDLSPESSSIQSLNKYFKEVYQFRNSKVENKGKKLILVNHDCDK